MSFLRKLVWLYFILLIFEGALRKWGIPALSAPLLLIRDPVVLLIYLHAARCGLSFRNAFNLVNVLLAAVTIVTATTFGIANGLVTIYGVLADFFQIPLVFLIPQILDRDDVLRMGKFFLYLVIPMAVLTVLQFRETADHWLNRGAMETHYDTVRPSATFSFSNGLTYFFSFASAFLFYGYLHGRTYKLWLLGAATFFTLIAAFCSGSRSCIVSIGLVMVVAILCVVMKGRGGLGLLAAAALIGVAVVALSSLSVADKGMTQLAYRFEDAGANENGATGFVARFFDTMFSAFEIVPEVPFFGYGLGSGTNGAAALFNAPVDLLWPENEWQRLVFECGPIFGLALCGFRAALTGYVGFAAYRAFRRDNLLPILLFAAGGLVLLNGQWGGPTPLGFGIFGGGLILAAGNEPEEIWHEEDGEHEHEDEFAEDEHFPAHGPV